MMTWGDTGSQELTRTTLLSSRQDDVTFRFCYRGQRLLSPFDILKGQVIA